MREILLFGWILLFQGVISLPTCVVDVEQRVSCNSAKLSVERSHNVSINKIFTADSCIAAGCCWMKALDLGNARSDCYESVDSNVFGYELINFQSTSTGYQGTLQLLSTGNTVYGKDLPTLLLNIFTISEEIIEVKITDATETRWEIPEAIFPRPHAQPVAIGNQQYRVQYTANPFTLQIIRKQDEEIVFNLDSYLVFKDQYIEFSLLSDNAARNTYGYGESARLSQALEVNRMYTLWAVDLPSLYVSENLYGSLPFGLQQVTAPTAANFGTAHGHVFLNSNGMDVTVLTDRINYKVLGGVIDFYVFFGSSAKQVIQQSSEIVGKPMMIPYWSLGFHNSRYGYHSIQEVEEIVRNYADANIPLDTQWLDIDYMREYRDFTLNETTFPVEEVQSFVNQLHADGQRLVPIIDPGIKVESGYDAYEKGKKLGIFIKDQQGNDYMGQVWPGPTHYPDFFHPNSQSYWTDQLKEFYGLVAYDGIWIDMNEVSNFCNKDGNGQVCVNDAPETCHSMSSECCLICQTVDPSNRFDFPPYHINNFYGKISGKTLSMSSIQYGNNTSYNTHNLYGLTEQIATNNALKDITQKRPFLLTRSSFLSTGKYSAKWSGDNDATWYSLKSSIVTMLDYNMFSIPMIGSDICGFMKDTTEELCARWIEVGAFYPFSRNHKDKNYASQEFYLWDTVTEAAQKALAIRYQLLPYYYTLFFQSHTQGIPVIQSLWMNFPKDSAVKDIDQQFLVGGAVMVSPVVERKARSLDAYFPKGVWYEFNSKRIFVNNPEVGQWVRIISNLTDSQVHIYGGSILPLQQPAMTTVEGRKSPFTYLVALSNDYQADGNLYWDDGEQIELNHYLSLQMHAFYDTATQVGKFTVNPVVNSWLNAKSYSVGTVEVLSPGMSIPKRVAVNHIPIGRDQWEFNYIAQSLTIKNLTLALPLPLEIIWE